MVETTYLDLLAVTKSTFLKNKSRIQAQRRAFLNDAVNNDFQGHFVVLHNAILIISVAGGWQSSVHFFYAIYSFCGK